MSYEKDVKEMMRKGGQLPDKLGISIVKYFWLASPLSGTRKDNIPKFLRKIEVLRNFTDNELRILSHYIHERTFNDGESIFRQNDLGVGFYLIYSGHVDVVIEHDKSEGHSKDVVENSRLVVSLERYDYFGELALLQKNSVRSATVIAKQNCTLLGLFQPDLEELQENYPVVATKLLQTVSLIIANRLYSITKEVRRLKYKLSLYEREDQGEDE